MAKTCSGKTCPDRTIRELSDLFGDSRGDKFEIRKSLSNIRENLDLVTIDNYKQGGKYSPDSQKKIIEKYNKKEAKKAHLDINKLYQ